VLAPLVGPRPGPFAFLLLGALLLSAIGARADEMDGWCAQVKKASRIVICSDAELRQQAIARNQFFEIARGKLSPEIYKVLNDDQSRWIKTYTARCGVSIDDPGVPSLPIPESVIECYRRESRARTTYLAGRLGVAAPSIPATASAPAKIES
jgi:hypothetical protein